MGGKSFKSLKKKKKNRRRGGGGGGGGKDWRSKEASQRKGKAKGRLD